MADELLPTPPVPSSNLPGIASSERFPTGIKGLDIILQGGFIRNGIYIIMGAPGNGKTILSNQVCFNHIAAGGRALYITLLSENHSRMLANLKILDFYNPAVVTDKLTFISGYSVLEREGLKGLIELVRKEIRTRRATLLVLDGLSTAEAVSNSPLVFKVFIDQLHAYTEVNNCTTLLLTHQSAGDTRNTYRPEYTMVDGIIELSDQPIEERSVRELNVTKLRGSAFLSGRHLFEITHAGLEVYPRLEAVPAKLPAFPANPRERVNFGIATLDAMLGEENGVLESTTTLLLGVPGSGKTILGLHFLAAGAVKKQKGLYFGFHETPPQILYASAGVGLSQFIEHVEDGLIEIVWQPPLEGMLDKLADQLLSAVRKGGVRRVFIDSFQGFEQAFYPQRLNRFFTALNNELRALGATTMMAVKLRDVITPNVQIPVNPDSTIFDNLIFLRYIEQNSQLVRLVSIIKERGSSFEPSIREFKISRTGLEIVSRVSVGEESRSGQE